MGPLIEDSDVFPIPNEDSGYSYVSLPEGASIYQHLLRSANEARRDGELTPCNGIIWHSLGGPGSWFIGKCREIYRSSNGCVICFRETRVPSFVFSIFPDVWTDQQPRWERLKHTKDVICQEVLLGRFLVGLFYVFVNLLLVVGFLNRKHLRHCLFKSLKHDGLIHPLVFLSIFF